MPNDFFINAGLFSTDFFAKLLANPGGLPGGRMHSISDSEADYGIQRLLEKWKPRRGATIRNVSVGKGIVKGRPDLPPHVEVLSSSESNIENGLIRPVMADVLTFEVDQNRTLAVPDDRKALLKRMCSGSKWRPDFIVFGSQEAAVLAVHEAQGAYGKKTPDGVEFCRDALFLVDAKKFSEPTDIHAYVVQVLGYLDAYDKDWGVLTNGAAWRLMYRRHKQREDAYLRFDLVRFLESLLSRGEQITADDRDVYRLFFNLFGKPAVGVGGVLDWIRNESEAQTREVHDILREQAHQAVFQIARGFLGYASNKFPSRPEQASLDELRELALIYLYRLLFILKAEARRLLPLRADDGGPTAYAEQFSMGAIHRMICETKPEWRQKAGTGHEKIARLFRAIDQGDPDFSIPAYNGGLFSDIKNPRLAELRLPDETIKTVLEMLIFLRGEATRPVPYADLDIRDLGDIYEGLLELRLLLDTSVNPPVLKLSNQRGQRKASGSYYTPEALVNHLVDEAVCPLLQACGQDAEKILQLKVLDPAMGSGHFLVRAVDVIASYLTQNTAPTHDGVPDDNGPNELAFWRRKVAENCIYGVDYNPMAVELAKVALWLHTAQRDRPLSFLDHHLKCGNSLLGVTLDRLAQPGLSLKVGRGRTQWNALSEQVEGFGQETKAVAASKSKRKKPKDHVEQMMLPFPIDTSLFSGIRKSIETILSKPSDNPEDVKAKSDEYERLIQHRLVAHRLLADLWCAQWFLVDATPEAAAEFTRLFDEAKRACGVTNDEERDRATALLREQPLFKRMDSARKQGYGPRPLRFFQWQLEFPEVAFDAQGQPRPGYGFDVVVGNPPWDKIKPEKRQFYAPFSEAIANTQGPSLNRLIMELENAHPELAQGWEQYEKLMTDMTRFLADAGVYRHQTAFVDGKKTGGDPDLFRYFIERAAQCAKTGGAIGYLVPCTLWQADGCTGLRRYLFNECTLRSLYTFENYRKWAFAIDSRFKFCAFVYDKSPPPPNHTFPSAMMLRDTVCLAGGRPERVLQLSRELVEAISPGTCATLDIKSDGDRVLIERLHRDPRLAPFGSSISGWNVKYRCELHMTNDAWRFRGSEWLKNRWFTRVRPVRQADGSWIQQPDNKHHGTPAITFPPGGEYWIAATADYYNETSGYQQRTTQINGESTVWFIHNDDLTLVNQPNSRFTENHFRILPAAIYTALYEGRMVHNFDHAQKAYVGGEGRQAIWREIDFTEKSLRPRVFVCHDEGEQPVPSRVGFCDVTGATNERTTLAALLPHGCMAGHKVPNFRTESLDSAVILTSTMGSFIWDYLIRLRVSTSMTLNFLNLIPVPRWPFPTDITAKVAERVLKLSCTTPEMTSYWNEYYPANPWSYASAERDLWKRAELRAELDAIMADLYGLTIPEYARVLTTFPLLDREYRSLSGDLFLTEGNENSKGIEGVDKLTTPYGIFECEPRSFITRDFALLKYIDYRRAAGDVNAKYPEDLGRFYREEVGLDPDGPLSRFRVGESKHLRERVERAKALGAIPYVPANRGGEAETGDEAATNL